ncbi:MAG: hypothetical protein E6K58_14245 [Nitrospirae bacterium]|nr:MAG: hypothetical protein E6K58_14245 [Nitrospirota bacterium]
MKTKREFPKVPDLRATWVPIYIEPIMNSGERLTIGVAAITGKGEALVLPTLREKELRCVFGDQAMSLLETAELALQTLRDHLGKTHSLDGWESPVSGVVVGQSHLGAGKDLEAILSMAMRLTASFYKEVSPVDLAVVAETTAAMRAPDEDEQWRREIRELVHRKAPILVRHFGHEKGILPGGGGRPPKFDYFGSLYVANFGRIKLEKIDEGFDNAKIKLWDLDVLKADSMTTGITQYELVLWQPRLNGGSPRKVKLLRETIAELQIEADKREMKTVPVFDAREASDRIITMEGLKK